VIKFVLENKEFNGINYIKNPTVKKKRKYKRKRDLEQNHSKAPTKDISIQAGDQKAILSHKE
jgi:hypothetical protein